VPYHVYTRRGIGAVGIIVETAKEALAKVAEFVEDGDPDVVIKDLLGNILDHAAVVAQAEIERMGLN
jgi:hypothetical protein